MTALTGYLAGDMARRRREASKTAAVIALLTPNLSRMAAAAKNFMPADKEPAGDAAGPAEGQP